LGDSFDRVQYLEISDDDHSLTYTRLYYYPDEMYNQDRDSDSYSEGSLHREKSHHKRAKSQTDDEIYEPSSRMSSSLLSPMNLEREYKRLHCMVSH
jgi:hypothetical protein